MASFSHLCPLAKRLYPLDGRDDVLPAELLLSAHGLDLDSSGPSLYAQMYNNGDLIVDSATSYSAVPALIGRVERIYDADILSTFLASSPCTTGVIVIVNKASIDVPAFALAIIFDCLPKSLVEGFENHQTLLHAPTMQGFFDEMPPALPDLLQLRIMRQALALEPPARLDAYTFDRLAFYARVEAVTLQEQIGFEKKRGDDGEALTRMGSRFPLLDVVVDLSILRLHGTLRCAEDDKTAPESCVATRRAIDLETKLGEALEACGDHSHAGLLYLEAALTYRTWGTSETTEPAEASWLREAAFIQFHNAGLAFKRCGSFVQAEAAYVKALQLAGESTERLNRAVKDLWMVYDTLCDVGSARARAEYLRCMLALACLKGWRPPNSNELLLQGYVLMKKARERLLKSLPGIATDPAAVRSAILATTNPKTRLIDTSPKSAILCRNQFGVSDGMDPMAAYSELVKDSCAIDVGFCAGCHKGLRSSKLQCCPCGSDGAKYCSKDCQRAHWPHHKLTCAARKANKKTDSPAPTEESLERARSEIASMKLRHDEREAEEAAARKAAESEKRARVAAQRTNRDTAAQHTSTRPTNDKEKNDKENAGGATPVPPVAGLAKRQAAKQQSLDAQRAHEAALREKEKQRVAQAEQQAEVCKLGERIARGE